MNGKDLLRRFVFDSGEAGSHWNTGNRRNTLVCIGEFSVRFTLGFLLSTGKVYNGFSPFGIAISAASPPGIQSAVTALGAVIGYIVSCETLPALKYSVITLLTVAAAYFLRELPLSRSGWFPALNTSVLCGCIGFVFVLQAGWSFEALSLYFSEIVLGGLSAYLYSLAAASCEEAYKEPVLELRKTVSIVFLLATSMVSLSSIELFGAVSLGRAAAVFLVMVSAYRCGITVGCTAALIFGIAMDISAAGAPYFSLVYGFSAIIGGIFSRYGRLPFAVSFVISDALPLVCAWEYIASPVVLYEVFVASVIFMLLPPPLIAKLGSFFPMPTAGYGALKAREYTCQRVEKISIIFRELYDSIKGISENTSNDNDYATVFDRASESVCRKCEFASRCWHVNYQETTDVMNNLVPVLLEHGSVQSDDLPDHFRSTCISPEPLMNAVNCEFRMLLNRQQYKNRLRERRGAAYNQYADISSLFHSVANELGGEMTFDPAAEKKLLKHLRTNDIDASAAVFRDKGGRLHAEISGASLYLLTKDPSYLDRLSSVLDTRLCTSSCMNSTGKLTLLEAEPLTVEVGIASVRRQGQSENGDRGTYFKTDEGILYIILSDGMGTGPLAAECSSRAIHILEHFLKAGTAPDIALRLLNDQMLLKNDADTSCATIDLTAINLFTGEACIYKYGAAPSYIRRGSIVKSVKCRSMAAGLGSCSESTPDIVKMTLRSSDCAVIISDGVVSAGNDRWLREAIVNYEGQDMKAMAKSLLESSEAAKSRDDDMTVLTVLMKERE